MKEISNEIIIFNDDTKISAVDIFTSQTMEEIISKIEKEARLNVYDPSTAKGRDEIASAAYKIARTKTTLDNAGKELTDEWRTKTSSVNEERKKARERLDLLKEEIRKPLTDYENIEKERIFKIEQRVEQLKAICGDEISKSFEDAIKVLEEIKDFDFQEFSKKAEDIYNTRKNELQNSFEKAKKLEDEKVELEKLRKEKEERERAEREKKMIEEAEERVRKEAEEKAELEKKRVDLEKQKREEEFKKQQEEQKRLEAEKIKKIEEDKVREQKARELAEKEKLEAIETAKREKEEAILQERKRVEEERAKIEREQKAREENQNHKKKINNEAKADLLKLGLSDKDCEKLIVAIAKNEVSNIKINY